MRATLTGAIVACNFMITFTRANAAEPAVAPLPATDGLIAHFDATALTSPGPVDEWTDSSGKKHHAKATSEAFRPTLVVESKEGVQVAYVRFDGLDDHLVAEALGRHANATLFLVARPRTNAGEFRGILSGGSAGQNDYAHGLNIDLGPFPTGDWSMLNVEASGAGGVANLLASPRPLGAFHVVSLRIDRKVGIDSKVDGKPESQRPCADATIDLARLFLGCRHYRNEPGPPYERGFFDGDLAEVVLFDRALVDAERSLVERYLQEKHAGVLDAPSEPAEAFQMLMPGFAVHTLPLDVTNINDMAYDEKGRLWLLGYDGRILIATDTDGDGLEDTLATYWDKATLQGPIAMVLRPDGVYVSSKTKISKIVDEDGDDTGDEEVIVASGWEPPENYSGGVDALGMAFDDNGDLYFALGSADFTNAYLIKDGKSNYSLSSQRGTIQRLTPDGKLMAVCTGVRFPVSLAIHPTSRQLFCTDQEGETWLPGGNPLDELLAIHPGAHYGFPPRHPEYLPDVLDVPAAATYGPQHQSTCGLVFNDATSDKKVFGPKEWNNDAFVTGYSRGKVWRTKLAGFENSWVGRTELIASSRMLLVDATISPTGDLVVSAHSGQPDWGSGPRGKGTIFKVRYDGQSAVPITAWAASPVEVNVLFSDGELPTEFDAASIEYGEHVRAGDRFEYLRPGYESVRRQLLAPRRNLPVDRVSWDADKKIVKIYTSAHPSDVSYALTLTSKQQKRRPIDVAYDLSGVETRWIDEAGIARTVWLPSLLPEENLQLGFGMRSDPTLSSSDDQKPLTSTIFRTRIRSIVEDARVLIGGAIRVRVNGQWVKSAVDDHGVGDYEIPLSNPLQLVVESNVLRDVGTLIPKHGDPTFIVPPLDAYRLPWAPTKRMEEVTSLPAQAPEIIGGDWHKGREIFHSTQAQCSACHKVSDKGGAVGPDLSNLVHRDVASVLRDIVQPSAAINPDYVPMSVLLTNGEVLSGVVRPAGEGRIIVTDSNAKERAVTADEIDDYKPSDVSVMPKGIDEKIGKEGIRDLLTFLTTAEPKPPASAEGHLPSKRTKSEVKALLAAIPGVEEATLRPLNIVLVASEQDHGPGEHDYPAWQVKWKDLLAKAPKTRVSTAFGWPEKSQFDLADVIIFYFWNHDWSKDRYEELDHYMARGGGVVVIHAATIADKEPDLLAQRIGLAFKFGPAKYRHGPVTLDIAASDSPITSGLKKLGLVDETYWGVTGEQSRIGLLATATEEGESRPILWTFEPESGGRVFASVIGHYSWTFDDPLFRAILLRGIAWSAGEAEGRLQPLAVEGIPFE